MKLEIEYICSDLSMPSGTWVTKKGKKYQPLAPNDTWDSDSWLLRKAEQIASEGFWYDQSVFIPAHRILSVRIVS